MDIGILIIGLLGLFVVGLGLYGVYRAMRGAQLDDGSRSQSDLFKNPFEW